MSHCADGRSPCAWEARYREAQDALALARYEAKKWKEKYAQEKQRRRQLARSLVETMALLGETRHDSSASPTHAKRKQRTSSTFSDSDQIVSLLSPTLTSFDFDDDDDNPDDDGDDSSDADGIVVLYDGQDDDVASRPTRSASIATATNGTSRMRATVGRATSQREVRSARSSTVGSPGDAIYRGSGGFRRGANVTMPPSNMLYRMLYAKPSSSRDLWSAQQASKFQSAARSVMFSMQLKKEHVFEHFFIVGTAIGRQERDQAIRSPTGLVGFWKPKVFYEFAQRQGRPPDPTIADFCFPMGVPVVKCKPHQVSTLLGSPVSIWTTDVDQLQRHALAPVKSSGYTFRLTGAKGEVLYGFCVSIMSPLIDAEDEPIHSPPVSPRGEFAKRASCPNGSALRLSEPLHESFGSSGGSKAHGRGKAGGKDSPASANYLAPICYCFTSKFPFYKLHFALLRQIIENDYEARQPTSSSARPSDLYEMTLTVESELGIEFAVCRQPTENSRSGSTTKTAASTIKSLSSVSSGIQRDRMGDATLSEEVPIASPPTQSERALGSATNSRDNGNEDPCHTPTFSNGLKKSFSSDDILSYKSANACVVEKPVVIRRTGHMSPRVAALVQVGDVLEAIDGVSTASLPFAQALELVKSAPRPLKLRFHRLKSRKGSEVSPAPVPTEQLADNPSLTALVPTSADILQRARRLRIGDPGQWTTLRLPDYTLNYQFPKRNAERWSVGVVLRFLSPANIVKILAHLLLEKQVVVMGTNSSQVTATCTALLLLLSPFQWQSTYIPQLPSTLLDFLHSPVPFLVGCQPLQSTDEWPDVCFFDIDANVILAPIADHHITPKSIPHGDELLRLFHVAAQRFQRLRSPTAPWHELSDDQDKILTLTMQESQIFLKDIGSELTSLQFSPADGKSFYERLQEEVSTIVRKSNYEDFLEELSQTQLFCQYCDTTVTAERAKEAIQSSV